MDNPSIDEAIGNKLRGVRAEKGLTQAQLAAKSGIAEITIWRAEKGQRSLRLNQLDALCNALDIEVHDFVEAAMKLRRAAREETGNP